MSDNSQPRQKGGYRKEAEDFCQQFQTLLGIPESVAKIIAARMPSDAGDVAKDFKWGRPSIRKLATRPGTPETYALALVREYVRYEEMSAQGKTSEFKLSQDIRRWLAAIQVALDERGEVAAKRMAGTRLVVCSSCNAWKFDGKFDHSPRCDAFRQEQLRRHQASQPSRQELEQARIKIAQESQKRARRMALRTSVPTPKHSKTIGPVNCPPIVPGGGIETKRR